MREELWFRKKLIKIIFFLVKFNLLAIPMYVILYFNFSFQPLQNFLAYLIFLALKIIGYDVSLNGYFLVIQNFPKIIEVSWDSTGWKSLYTLAALIIATPLSNFNRKSRFLLLALPAIFLINYVRVLTTILISVKFGFEYFEIVHTFLWREGLILVIIAFWVLYLIKR
ncbi:MAG: exosortase/archaeosortase family protein [Candidatus Aenigmarchaeota archaeon]|nr:exosortase/archaeosortase family protein [Candidatus Aenigmarchaeota archaeon]